ncbi:hypothetical protein C2R22_22125 (plasmid) [Salinigranum rubrum]|uniref:NmrA-like domain-containing protein n=1 Tax=Salinigranum rubrum TaxID=755307 RepID=A0A2I8VQQ3_9EURY|nr:hypothetical protein C2R22_22125 [Salinigranum rubrum]
MSQFSVLVVGATGRQGGAVADHLLSSGYRDFDVHALTRSPESDRAQALGDQGATLVEGNLLEKSLKPSTRSTASRLRLRTAHHRQRRGSRPKSNRERTWRRSPPKSASNSSCIAPSPEPIAKPESRTSSRSTISNGGFSPSAFPRRSFAPSR